MEKNTNIASSYRISLYDPALMNLLPETLRYLILTVFIVVHFAHGIICHFLMMHVALLIITVMAVNEIEILKE